MIKKVIMGVAIALSLAIQAEVLSVCDSMPVAIDSRQGVRYIPETNVTYSIQYDSVWVDENESAEVVITDNGVEIKRATGSGTFDYIVKDYEPHVLTYTTYIGGVAQEKVYTATLTAIGGDYLLVRVGAMYHDIGKISNPQCFIENAAPGVNYHAGLSPMESAQEIIKHVEDGVEIAKKHNLPQIVIDFITSHHAKSQTMYFYNQYCNQGGDPEKIDEFTYNGTYPTSKEQVVVMMADAVEAASRSLKDYSAESISNLVDSITKQRLTEDSQLVQADISIKDINIVRAVFKKHLQEIYHARIAYPKRNK